MKLLFKLLIGPPEAFSLSVQSVSLDAPAVCHGPPVALPVAALTEVEPPHAPLLGAPVGHPDHNAATVEEFVRYVYSDKLQGDQFT